MVKLSFWLFHYTNKDTGPIIGATAEVNPEALAEAAIAAGLAPTQVGALIGAAFGGLADAFAYSFRFVWVCIFVFYALPTF